MQSPSDEAIHRFLGSRKWRPLVLETRIGVATWMELFILFDTQGYRRREKDYIAVDNKKNGKERRNDTLTKQVEDGAASLEAPSSARSLLSNKLLGILHKVTC